MRSAVPKVLHPILGRPMILWPILAAQAAGAGRVVVIDGPKRPLDGLLPDGVEVAVQQEPKGTGDAVRAAASHIDPDAPVLVINGDVPLITPEVVKGLADAHAESGAAATMATMELDDPSGYGRVVRGADGSVERVVETKAGGDATPGRAGHPRGQHRRLRVRRRRAARGAGRAELRQRAGRALPARRAAAAARAGQAGGRAPDHRPDGDARHQRPPPARRGRRARAHGASTTATCSPA